MKMLETDKLEVGDAEHKVMAEEVAQLVTADEVRSWERRQRMMGKMRIMMMIKMGHPILLGQTSLQSLRSDCAQLKKVSWSFIDHHLQTLQYG